MEGKVRSITFYIQNHRKRSETTNNQNVAINVGQKEGRVRSISSVHYYCIRYLLCSGIITKSVIRVNRVYGQMFGV